MLFPLLLLFLSLFASSRMLQQSNIIKLSVSRHSINCFSYLCIESCLFNYNAIDILYHVASKESIPIFSSSCLLLIFTLTHTRNEQFQSVTCKYSYRSFCRQRKLRLFFCCCCSLLLYARVQNAEEETNRHRILASR